MTGTTVTPRVVDEGTAVGVAGGSDDAGILIYESYLKDRSEYLGKWSGSVFWEEDDGKGAPGLVPYDNTAIFSLAVPAGRLYRVSLQVRSASLNSAGRDTIAVVWQAQPSEQAQSLLVDLSDRHVHNVYVDLKPVITDGGAAILTLQLGKGEITAGADFHINHVTVKALAGQVVYSEDFESGVIDRTVWGAGISVAADSGIDGRSGFIRAVDYPRFLLGNVPAGLYRFSMQAKKGSGNYQSDTLRVHPINSNILLDVDLSDGQVHTFAYDIRVPEGQDAFGFYIGRWDTSWPGGGGGASKPIPSPDAYIDNVQVVRLQQSIGEFKPSCYKSAATLSRFSIVGFPDELISHYEILVWARYLPDRISTLPWQRISKTGSYEIPIPPPPSGAGALLNVSFQLVGVDTSNARSQDLTGIR